mgnify:CR=1 FL=1
MSKEKGHFKGRVIKIEGSKIIIDTKAEFYTVKVTKTTPEGKAQIKVDEIKTAKWDNPDMPKIGDIVRGIFRSRK